VAEAKAGIEEAGKFDGATTDLIHQCVHSTYLDTCICIFQAILFPYTAVGASLVIFACSSTLNTYSVGVHWWKGLVCSEKSTYGKLVVKKKYLKM